MAAFQWTPDVPAGVLRNNALSRSLRRAAIAETKFMPFVKAEPGYGKKKGETLTVTRVRSLTEPVNPRLSETSKIPVDPFSIATRAVIVSEWGRGVEYTNLADELLWFNLDSELQMVLKDQMKLCLDTGAAAAFKAAKIKYIPTSLTGGVFDTDGTPSTQATENLTVAHAGEIRDYLSGTLFAPPIDVEGNYIGLASTKALRGLKNDPDWEEWNKYNDPKKKYNSEVGKIEGIRWIEVNHAQALSGLKGLANVLGEAVVFGRDAVGMATAHDPELLVKIPTDYGRDKGCAWYGILEFFDIWDTANPGEARVIHITSS
jgi:N4-gp56 family major capsid protein